MYGKVLSLPFHAIVILSNLFFSSKAHFPANVFHEITGITDALKQNVHDQNEQTITNRSFYTKNIRTFISFGLYVTATRIFCHIDNTISDNGILLAD